MDNEYVNLEVEIDRNWNRRMVEMTGIRDGLLLVQDTKGLVVELELVFVSDVWDVCDAWDTLDVWESWESRDSSPKRRMWSPLIPLLRFVRYVVR